MLMSNAIGPAKPLSILPADLAAFDPDRRLHRRMRLAMLCLGALLVGPVALAALVPIGGAVVAPGSVGVASTARRISHPVGGVIAWIGVAEGQRVKRGQPLLRFEDTVSSAGASLSNLSIYQLLAQRGRLEAERVDAPAIRFDPELLHSSDPGAAQAMADEQRLFGLRRSGAAAMTAQLAARVHGYREQISGYSQQIASFARQGVLIAKERDGVESLYRRGLVTLSRRNELERGVEGITGSSAELTARIGQASASITEAREQMLQIGETRRADAATQLAQLNAELNQQRLRSVTAGDLQSRTEIRATVDGVAGKLAFTSLGEVVRPAEPILEIVPSGDAFMVEAEVSPTDIDQIRRGQPVRVRLSGLNQATTPELAGEVSAIAPDRTVDEASQRAFYKVRVRISDPAAKRLRLTVGMPAEIFARADSRSMLSYLTKPLRDQFARAFRDSN